MTGSVESTYGFENPFRADPLVRKALRYCKGKKLLDVGCGEGADSVYYAKRGFHVTAVDRNESYLEPFREYRRDHALSAIRIIRRDALRYGYPRNTYDVISCILVLCCMKRSEC